VAIREKLKIIGNKAKSKLSQDSRNNRAVLTGAITLAVRGLSLLTGLVSIPITAQYLGKEQFGIWLLLSTFMGWVTLADLGLTNSLVNTLTTSLARDDRKKAKQAVSSAFFPMVALSIFLLFTTILLSNFIPWEKSLNIHLSTAVQQDTRWAIVVAMCFFAIKIPLSIPRCIYNAHQEGYIYQCWIGLANILSLLSLFISQYYHANLPWLLGTFFGAVIVGDIFAGIDIFYFRRPWLYPEYSSCNMHLLQDLLKIGFQFWVAQVVAICIFQTDLIIVANLFGVVEVATYGTLMKLFTIVEAVSSSFLTPLWPAYSDANTRGDYQWIRKTFQRSVVYTFIWSICAGGVITVLSPMILHQWLGKDTYISPALPVSMLITFVLIGTSYCIAMLVNGLGRLKKQTIFAPMSAVCNLVLSIILGKAIGVNGVTIATTISVLIFSVVAQLWLNNIYEFIQPKQHTED
jgi:O-antigen/teichoic acid export membrane protein